MNKKYFLLPQERTNDLRPYSYYRSRGEIGLKKLSIPHVQKQISVVTVTQSTSKNNLAHDFLGSTSVFQNAEA